MESIVNPVHEEVKNQLLVSTALRLEPEIKKKVRVFEKIGRPAEFKPVNKIANKNIEKEWVSLYEHLCETGICLYVRNPNVRARELYRFVTEEVFKMEVDNSSLPGMMTCFVYDEFYPDHKYDNRQIAIEECIRCFFEKKEFYDFHFSESVQLNDYNALSKIKLHQIINLFRTTYDDTRDLTITARSCSLKDNHCRVTGFYKVILKQAGEDKAKSGGWFVEFLFDDQVECWYISKVQIRGIEV